MRLRVAGEMLVNGMRIGGTFMLKQQLLGCRRISSFVRFNEYLLGRREQAGKSLLIQVNNASGAEEVKEFLQTRYGRLESLYYYSIPKKVKGGGGGAAGGNAGVGAKDNHWLLAEFSSRQSALDCISSCEHGEGTLPFKSSMMCYQDGNGWGGAAAGGKRGKKKGVGDGEENGVEIKKEVLLDTPPAPNFKKGQTLSEQMRILEDSTKLSELGIRVRFFVASQLEQAFNNLFPNGCVLPFGSTVSGIGRQSGDLDLVMVPDMREIFPEKTQPKEKAELGGKMVFQSKVLIAANTSNARFQSQRVMETMADVIQMFVPGCNHVQRILQARVPILRFWSDFTDLQCDLSMTNS